MPQSYRHLLWKKGEAPISVITHHTTLPDSAQKTDFYSLIDNATATGIVDSDIASTAAIADSKLASITTAGKVNGSALTSLSSIPSGAGSLPSANLPSTIPVANIDTGTTANKILKLDSSARIPAVDGSLLTNLIPLLASITDYGTGTSSGSSVTQNTLRIVYGTISSVANKGSQAITGLPFASASSYVAFAIQKTSVLSGLVGGPAIIRNSGSQMTVYNASDTSYEMSWIAIGT